MVDHPPFVSITQTLIRINATAVEDLLPDEVTTETHAMKFDLDDDNQRLVIEFVKRESGIEGVYKMYPRSGGYHTGSGTVRDRILDERGVGRYACDWDGKRLVVDLETEAMEPQSRFEFDF